MAERPAKKVLLERVYVWELPVRLTHWVLFFAILILSATGYYIAHPFIAAAGPARDHFVMGTMRAVHLYAAGFFTAAVVVRIYWFIAGNEYARLGEFIPWSRRRLKSLIGAFQYYSFIRHQPEDYAGHNALAGATYILIFAIYLVMIATGLVLYTAYAPPSSVLQIFGFLAPWLGGLQVARLVHHIGMWVVLAFAMVHVYFVLLSSIIEHIGIFDSIFSGYKFMPEREADNS